MPTTVRCILKRAVLVLPLLCAIFLLTDNQTHEGKAPHHLAIVTAFERHPPSLRVFRSIFEFNLMLWCTAFALWVWSSTVGTRMVGHLLFQPAPGSNSPSVARAMIQENGAYASVSNYGGDNGSLGMQQSQSMDDADDREDLDQDASHAGGIVGSGNDDDDDVDDIENVNVSLDMESGASSSQSAAAQSAATVTKATAVEIQSSQLDNSSAIANDANVDNGGPHQQQQQQVPPNESATTDAAVDSDDGDDDDNDDNNNDDIFLDEDNNDYFDENVEPLLDEPEPPNPLFIAKIAINNLLFILITLFFFIISSAEGGKYVDGMSDATVFHGVAAVAAPVFPLVLFLGSAIQVLLPWSRRKEFWKIISLTMGAPMYEVTFRDGFIGDIITSSVRPMQDSSFTLFYLLSGLKGWWEQSYGWDAADRPLEKNWILHTWILPMCMASPLWWRFMQNLRQVYDAKKRWPYLGNALKYFIAAQVALFGVYNPTMKNTAWWLGSFVVATLYQVYWDIFMDWDLFIVDNGGASARNNNATSRIRMRETRIYRSTSFYWFILVINFLLRFCWTLSFLPRHYLNKAGILDTTFKGDVSSYLNPAIAAAEIIRRTLWGLLRVENEAIKVAISNPKLQESTWGFEVVNTNSIDDDNDDDEIQRTTAAQQQQYGDDEHNASIMSVKESHNVDTILSPPEDKQTNGMWISNDISMLRDLQILGELCFYSVAFSALGLLAAYHRDIL